MRNSVHPFSPRPVDRWKETLHAGQSASSKDFPALTKKIDEGATACAAKLAQGLKILGAVKKNRAAFPHIDDRELRSRDDFMREMDVMCKDIKAQLTSPESKKRIADDKKKVRVLECTARAGEFESRLSSARSPSSRPSTHHSCPMHVSVVFSFAFHPAVGDAAKGEKVVQIRRSRARGAARESRVHRGAARSGLRFLIVSIMIVVIVSFW